MSKRSRVPAVPAPDEQVWFLGLRWVEAVRMQTDRFEVAFRELEAAHTDATQRARLNKDDALARSWRESGDAQGIGDRPSRVPTVALSMQVGTEADFLLVAVRNLQRAQVRLPEHLRTAMTDQDAMHALRNLSEHWDDSDGPAAHALRTQLTHIVPGGIAYTTSEVWIGGEDGVPLSRIRAWAIRVWKALDDALREAGIEPERDLNASVVEGDDDLAWPGQRLRYSWTIPQLPEEE